MANSPKKLRRPKRDGAERWILPPGVTTKQYAALKRTWDAKLAESGFKDIEHMNNTGQVSHLFNGYSSQGLGLRYQDSTLDFFILARRYLHRANWTKVAPKGWHKLYYFLWDLYSDGVEFTKIEAALKKKVSNSWGARRKPTYGTSIWFIHTTIKKIETEFLAHLKRDPEFFD